MACCLNIFFFIASLTFYQTIALQSFVSRIPNGGNVPNVYCGSGTWIGVGHKNPGGEGDVNKFGDDFDEIGENQWTTTVCQKDSDGDGKSNGEELGDPNCTWRPGQADPTGMTISHPGICEPINSATCVNSAANQFLGSIRCSGTSSNANTNSSSNSNSNSNTDNSNSGNNGATSPIAGNTLFLMAATIAFKQLL